MSHTKNLEILSSLLIRLETAQDNNKFFVLAEKYITILTTLLNQIKEEAIQTPAGARWFKGQLEINKSISIFFNNVQVKGDLKSKRKKSLDSELNYKTLHDELIYLLNSGKDRYISV